jgi:dTDP-glucose 4,6-dehydratase
LKKNARFLLASTSEVYGDPLEHPQSETYNGNVDPTSVRAVYDESKRFAETMTMSFHQLYGLRSYIVRIFNTYGPRMALNDGRVVPNFIAQALQGQALTVYGKGEQTRSFQYVDDLIDGITLQIQSNYHKPINIGNPHEMTILEFALVINELTDNPAGIRYEDKRTPNDPQTRCPDISLAKQVLGWRPKVSLEEGLRKTIAYFKNLSAGAGV